MKALIEELKTLLKGRGAHVGLKEATADIPFNLLGERPHNLPYSIWQLVEHIRIAQWDMLEFSIDASHKSPKWPDGYWPAETAPADINMWNKTLKHIDDDLKTFVELIETKDVFEPIPKGNGQNLLRESLQIADHAAYHTAEIVIIRRLLGIWKNSPGSS